MYLKHVRLYKRHSSIKSAKRRVTLNHLDAILRCYSLIIKMARLRFPGRPGQRIGKNYVKYALDDLKLSADTCIPAQNKIEVGLKLFHDLFGYSDEEDEDFDGFTSEEIANSEANLALKVKQNEKLQRILDSNNSSPSTSDIEKLFSSDSESSSSSIRRSRGMRDILRKSYDKMLKDGLGRVVNKSNIHNNSLNSIKPITSIKSKHVSKASIPSRTMIPKPEAHIKRVSNLNACESKSDDQINAKSLSESKLSVKKSVFTPHLEKAQHQGKTRRRRKRSMRPNVKKKFPGRFMYPTTCKYSTLRNRLPTINENVSLKNKLRNIVSKDRPAMHLGLDTIGHNSMIPESSNSLSVVKEPLKPKTRRPFAGHKRFVLPSMSARSSRKIIPRKRYIDEYDFSKTKIHEEDSQCSRSSLSGSSETISAMDGGSSPDNSQLEDARQSRKFQKKVGLLDRPLVVEGKRAWKPSLKVQMKLSQMNCEYPFALKKNLDDSSGTGTSSGSFKDIIKPDMVSKYAEKMAQKPKERPFKILESFKRSVPQNIKSETEKAEVNSSDNSNDSKDKVAAKIEKLLKSQWEGRLKDPAAKLLNKVESPVEQWMSAQQERTSTQRRTKTIIRKARLQLKKRNLNLRTRKTDKDLSNIASDRTGIKDQMPTEKEADSIKGVSSIVGLSSDVVSKSSACASLVGDSDTPILCIVCGCSKIFAQPEKLYDQMSCETCSKFFSTFAESPKQYFCTKDGDCSIDGSRDMVSRKLVNSRCKACWLKICMEKFTVSTLLKDQLLKYVPRLDAPPHNVLLFVDNTDEAVDGVTRGPRIKHVCRRAAVALGLPRATFSDASVSKESFNLSALPEEEKQKILETVPLEDNAIEADTVVAICDPKPSTSASKVGRQPVKKKSRKDVKVKNRVHLDLLKKSSLLIQKEQKRRKLLMKKSMKHLRKHSFKKSVKVGKKSEMKKTLKFSYKSAVKTSLKTSPRLISKRPLRSGKFRKARCKQCAGCLAEDCGECTYCLDKKKFGGPNLIKQACMHRRCLCPILPPPEKKSTKPSRQENKDKNKPFGGHSSFGGDGPSLSSSSPSSPTSPDSSCGSSCSSTSSSSSSGSSGSSSSSSRSSSSTSSTSSSDDISVQRTNALNDGCGTASFMQSAVAEPVILQGSECMDNNVVTNPIFQEQVFGSENCSIRQLVGKGLGGAHTKVVFSDQVVYGSVDKESGDTILFEDSSSLIELKNASFAPSLLYGTAGDQEDSVSYSSNTESKTQNSRQNNSARKPPYGKEQDQYGSAGSGSQESNGDEDDDEDDDDDQKKKHYIYADYWEDYDFDRISSQGFALISSQQIPLPCACFLCGSAGEEKLIFCVLCCEPYHTFCLPEADSPRDENLENWCCKRCQCCSVCGLKHNLLKCKICQQSCHAECLTPSYPTKPSRKKKIWVCPKCVKCKSCGTTSPVCGNGLLWNFDLLLCQPCAKLTDKGNYCPVCRKCYEENDYESEMVQCFKCNRWVHASCDDITAEGYEILSCLPDTVVYTCVECTVEETPMWKKAIKEYLKHGLKSVLNSLLSARCARHLIKQDCLPSELSNYLSTINSTQRQSNTEVERTGILSEILEKESNANISVPSEDDLQISAEVKATVFSLLNSLDPNPLPTSESNETNLSCFDSYHDQPINSFKRILVMPCTEDNSLCNVEKDSLNSPDLLEIKHNLETGKYQTITLFFDDVVEAIELGNELGMKHHTSETKSVLIKETERIFPWFKVPTAKVWRSKIDLPDGMLPNAVIPPYIDHTYSQYLDRVISYPSLNLKEEPPLLDNRTCVLCSYTGDSMPKKCGRLLYCGQDDWIHVNCVMWSAEVFEQHDGSLRNVYPAISRGKLMHCEFCSQLGATVGCCVRGCPANYHFYCARKDEAILQEDRKVFCALHKENVDARIVDESDFPIEEKVFVNQTSINPKWVKKKWESLIDVNTLHVIIGSLTIKKLGHLTTLSTYGKILIPVDYECTRLFWSTKNPHIRVKYTCRVIQMQPDKTTKCPVKIANTTTVHTPNSSSNNYNEIKLLEEIPIVTSSTDSLKHILDKNTIGPKIEEIRCEVEKLLYRLVKKVTKRQRKDQLQLLKEDLLKNNNTLELNKNRNSIYDDVLSGKKDIQLRFNGNRKKLSDAELDNCFDCDNDLNSSESLTSLENESVNCDSFEGLDKSDYLDYYASLFKVNSNLDVMHDKTLPSELSNSDTHRNSAKKHEFKKYRKKIKTTSLTGEPDIDSATIIQLLAEKEVAKEKYECALKKFRGMKCMSPKMKSLLKSVIPTGPVSETVLPIFSVGSKENNVGITESSGYSSNEDGHFRLPSSIPGSINKNNCKAFGKNAVQSNSAMEIENLKQVDSDCSEIMLNGENNLNSTDAIANNTNQENDHSAAKSENSAFNNLAHHRTYSKGKSLNGMCQSMIPFKCCKCKRVYRTSESFKKHSESCNFFLDSSSDDEGSDSSNSSELSYMSSSNSSVKIIEESIIDTAAGQNKKPDSFNMSKPHLNLLKDFKTSGVDETRSSANNQNNCIGQTIQPQQHIQSLENNLNLSSLNRHSESQNSTHCLSTEESFSSDNQSLPSLLNHAVEQFKSTRAKELNQIKLAPNKTMIQPSPPIVSPPIECTPIIPQPPLQSVTLNANNISVISENASNAFNCGYGTTLCNNSTGGVVSMPCNTLIIPPTPNTVQNPSLGQIPVPQNNFLSNPIEINAGSQLSYVGSITITNNETMSLAVNVPDQIVPMFPQQDLNFGVIQNPMQMHQPTEIHLQQVNVQHISVQSSFSANSLNQIVFPQQAMTFPQGQVMFMENPVAQQMPSAQAPQNYLFQVPVEQTQNCAYTTFIPQQGMQPQFVNQFAFQPTPQHIQSQQVQNVLCQQQNLVTQQVPGHQQLMGLTNQVNNSFMNNPVTSTSNNQYVRQVQMTPNPTSVLPVPNQRSMPSTILPKPSPVSLNSVTPTAPDLSSRSSPASDVLSSRKNRVSAIAVPPNSDIVDILKRAAEKMLSMSAEKAKQSGSEVPEKKTRFAHTRKVAARKLEKLKQRNAVLNGNVPTTQPPQEKPKSVQFNIAALKPTTFSIPFVPLASTALPSNSPSPMSDQVQQPSPQSERFSDSPMPLLNADVPLLDNNSDIYCYNEEPEKDSPLLQLHMQGLENRDKENPHPNDKPYLMYEINSEDGFHVQSRSLRDAWMKVYDELQDARMATHMKPITLAPEDVNGIRMMGLDNPALLYLLEQLPGAECCIEHDFLFHPPAKELIEIPENATGCARSEEFSLRREYDMFNFLASEHRNRPVFLPPEEEEEGAQKSSRRSNSMDQPIANRFRFLKTTARETVGVYRSSIHGRGLFCKRNIDPGELVIEYAGEVIRSILTDKRERIYQSKGIGCYMFRIDDDEVVDATMHGNAARFINHSCEPNCFSKVINVDSKKHIVIFALRRIIKGEELTYDYKFPFEEEKIPCHCNTRRCRKYLN